jgi:outer membrane protein OmpA-like peptidoglycan-associated protein
MAFNLIDSVKGLFGNDLSGKAASLLGENETGVKNAISGIVPSILMGLLSKAGAGDLSGLLNMTKDASHLGALGNLSGVLGNSNLLSKGFDMLKSLFGDKLGNVTSAISNFSGIKESSAASLMNMAAPATLGVVGQHAAETNMSAGSFASFLNSQKDHILNAIPSGLNLAGAMGLSSLAGIGSKLSSVASGITGGVGHAATSMAHTERKTSSNRWMWTVLIAIILIVILFYLVKGCNGSDKAAAVVDTTAKAVDTTTPAVVTPVRESLKVKLPDGTELDVYKGGIEDQLVTFLNNPAGKPGKNVWFDFDNLNFNTGSSVITDSSMKQVQNIVAILKAFPKVKIKIGGYTDRTGDSLSNIKLSKSRADAVVAALKKSGANMAQVLGGEGYGSQYAKAAPNASDDEKQKDRRISVSVRTK